MEKDGKALKVWAWIFIVLTVIFPLFAIGAYFVVLNIKIRREKARNYYKYQLLL